MAPVDAARGPGPVSAALNRTVPLPRSLRIALACGAMLCGTVFVVMGAMMLRSTTRDTTAHPVSAAVFVCGCLLVAGLFGLAGYRVMTGKTSRRYTLGSGVRWVFGGLFAVGVFGLLVRAWNEGNVWVALQAVGGAFFASLIVRSAAGKSWKTS